MISHPPVEARLELYADRVLDQATLDRITAFLFGKWPVQWDVHVPSKVSFDHPARWHAIVPRTEAETPALLHQKIVAELVAMDPERAFHYRTRWAFIQTPNEQEIFEESWKPAGKK
jgi:hypothetical protein